MTFRPTIAPKGVPQPPETRPLPSISFAAFALLEQSYARQVNDLALQTLAAMGLAQKDGWRVYPQQGIAVLEVVKT